MLLVMGSWPRGIYNGKGAAEVKFNTLLSSPRQIIKIANCLSLRAILFTENSKETRGKFRKRKEL